jgi:hypothetical protein
MSSSKAFGATDLDIMFFVAAYLLALCCLSSCSACLLGPLLLLLHLGACLLLQAATSREIECKETVEHHVSARLVGAIVE